MCLNLDMHAHATRMVRYTSGYSHGLRLCHMAQATIEVHKRGMKSNPKLQDANQMIPESAKHNHDKKRCRTTHF